jgi:hypothetical protein
MAKLGLTIMSVIAMAVTTTSCGNDDKELLTTTDPTAKTTVEPQEQPEPAPAEQH